MPEPSEQTSVTRLSTLPLIAVRDVVVFPHMSLPLSVGRVKSIRALEEAMSGPKMVLAVAQRDARVEDPQEKEVYHLGTLCEIVQYLKMPDGSLKVFLQGIVRAQADRLFFAADKNCWFAEVSYPSEAWKDSVELKVLVKQIHLAFEEYARIGRRVPQDLVLSLQQMMPSPSRFADTIAAHLSVPVPEKQKLLESAAIKARLEQILALLKGEIEILNLEGKIHSRVRTQISKSQKEYYLNEQMKAIQKELRQKDDAAKEIDDLRVKVKRAKMPKPAEEACNKEISRLEKMMPFSPEATVCRTYLDWMISLPWSRRTKDRIDLERARRILDEDHFGLKKAKERILEYLAVCKFTKRLKGPILCFVGPPGVGKTSLGLSIARALGREFVRMSLGGVRDEAEIRGHRRTYIGSLPGRVIKSMKRVKSKNPVFLLDEIDKMGVDWRGDPAAALLEVLDPEQNSTFVDHYLDTEFDLSEVLFICTANTLHGIPVSLQDRMEMIRFSGYTEMEKVFIVKKYLLPKLLVEHGLKRGQVKIDDAAIIRVIREYTQEAGVRNVQREAASLVRKGVKALVEKKKPSVRFREKDIPAYLGIRKHLVERICPNGVGIATGLAWTDHGGETLTVEAVSMPGKGNLILTGKLGKVMKESGRAAMSYLRVIAKNYHVGPEAFAGRDFHVHVPEGAVPKDGPSAGIVLATALASLVSQIPVEPNLAMTGEVTLSGRVLPVGGIKEKLIAAHREKLTTVIYPEANKKDLEEIPEDIQKELRLIPVKHMDQVLDIALGGKTKRKKISRKGRRRAFGASMPMPHPLPDQPLAN